MGHPGPLGPSRIFLQKAVASGGSNLARLGELGGNHLPYFAINRGGSEEEKGNHPPSFLGSMESLRKLDLSLSGLMGLILHELGNLSNLQHLNLGYSYALQIDNLNWISRLSSLDNNTFTCPIPSPFTNLSSLGTLNLAQIRLNGTISKSFEFLKNLQVSNLGANSLTGDMPVTFGTLSNLVTLYLSSNLLEGSIKESNFKMATPPSSPPPPPPLPTSATSQSPSTLKQTRKATWLRSLTVDLATKTADDTNKKKLRTYLGIIARDKAEFDIPEASDPRTKNKMLQTLGERWRQNQNMRKKAQAIQKQNTAPHMLSRGGYEYLENNLMDEKKKKKLEEAAQSGSIDTRHVKWKMACTKKTSQMTSKAAKEIAQKIAQASQGSFVAHGPDVTIKQYFGTAPRTSRTSSSMAFEDLEQLMQQIRDQLEESITEKVTRQLMLSFIQMQSQFQSQMQSQELTLPPEPEVGPSTARVITKESCVDPSGNDPDTVDSNKYGLYIEENSPRLVALGRVYEGSTIIHNIPLLHDQVKVGVEEVRDADAPIPGVVGLAKPTDRPNHDINDPLYLMTLTIPQLFLKPLQVMWDAIMFGVFNEDFPLYIKHMTQTSMRAGNVDENVVIWFCSLHNRPDNYLKGIINSALKGLDDTPQSKSKAGARWIVVKCNRQNGSTECGYYYFNDARPLEPY
ncbi:Receptor-like protein 12 [Glycine soja]